MATSTCDSTNLKELITEIKSKINGDVLNTKMIEHLETLTYDDNLDLDFISLVIGRIINEKSLDLTDLSALKSCVNKTEIINCDILLLKLLQSAKKAIAAASNKELKEFIEECEKNYPKLSYHLKMRIQYVLYKNIYKINGSPLNTEDLRKEFVNFFDKRCLNAQYRNILYSIEKAFLNEIDGINDDTKFNAFKDKLNKSIFNLSNDPNNLKFLKSDETELNITDFASFNKNKADLKALFEEKMKIMGGYNNKQGNLTYYLCGSNVKISIKKVQAKSAREAVKIIANKVLKKNEKKSVKFSIKRMIGKKEKYYNYKVSVDKTGKISIETN